MIPKYLLPKDDNLKPNKPETITIPKSSGKVICENCGDKYPIESGYIILRPDGNQFKPLCLKCTQIRMFGKIAYLEDYPTFFKRLKSGYFKDWKVSYEENQSTSK